jgi:hypothetical protein
MYVPTYQTDMGIPKVNKYISELINSSPVEKLVNGKEFKLNEKVVF